MVAPLPARRWPGRLTFVIGLAASMLFAVYGSLVPFDLRIVPLDEAARRFLAAMALPLQLWSKSDLIANVMLMVPVAVCLMAVCRLDRRGVMGALLSASGTLVFCAAFANLLEFLQVFTPDRTVSKSDVLAQTIGAACGIGAWVLAGQPMVDWLRGTRRSGLDARLRRLHALLAIYAVAWLVTMALPLELTLSPVAWLHKYRDGNIVLVPFSAHYDSRADLVWDVVGGLLAAVPLGALAWLTALHRHWRAPRRAAWLLGAAFVSAGEFVQVCETHRVADVTDVMIGTIGAMLGVSLAARLQTATGARDEARIASRESSSLALGQVLAWCAVLVFYHWKPFAFTTDIQQIRARLTGLSLMPLAQYVHASTGPQLLLQMLVKAALGVPLGLTLAHWARNWWHGAPYAVRLRWLVCLLLALGVLGGIETGQIFLPDRVPDITDAMAGWLGAASGMALVLHGPLARKTDEAAGAARRGTQDRQVGTVQESRLI